MSDSARTHPEQLARIREHCQKPPQAVALDEPGGLLWDVASGKSLSLELASLERVEARQNAQTGQPYLLLIYGSGRQLALADVGIAFPRAQHGPEVPTELPPVVCWRDFQLLQGRLSHELYDHPDRPPSKDAVGLVMACLAILEGARAAGFDVGREERALEGLLSDLEKRVSGR